MITVNVIKDNLNHQSEIDYLDDEPCSKKDDWQNAMQRAIRNPRVLLEMLGLSIDKYKTQLNDTNRFSCLVPMSYVDRMEKGNWDDPLLKQVLPIMDETVKVSGFVADPVGDLRTEVSSGVLHKYQGRVLLITTGACAVHCRYCFRQHFPYADSLADQKNWQKTLSMIRQDSSISEVILSGGDPLMLSDKKLERMCFDLAEIPHLRTLRFHSRIPIFLPERINPTFLSWTAKLPLKKVMVIHANHAKELDSMVGSRLEMLRNSGFILLNQSVLLKGINDTVEDLSDLSHALFAMDVIPYYIHQLDKVDGAAHFEVSKQDAILLLNELKGQLSGYLVPRFVEEISGERSKRTIV